MYMEISNPDDVPVIEISCIPNDSYYSSHNQSNNGPLLFIRTFSRSSLVTTLTNYIFGMVNNGVSTSIFGSHMTNVINSNMTPTSD